MTDTAWLHNLDPFLVQFSEDIGIRWYGLAYVMGFLFAYCFVHWFSIKKITPLTTKQVSDFSTAPILGVLIGGRLGYALFYSPSLFTDFRSELPFWGVLAVWEGGMASHGGFIGVFLACLYFSKKSKIHFSHLGDLLVVGGMIGIAFGRIANFINGELMGRVCRPDFLLAVKFPQDMYRWIGYHPEKIENLKVPAQILGVPMENWYRWIDNVNTYKYQFYGLAEKIIEQIQNGNQEMIEAMRPLLEPRHPSQLYACLTEGLIPLIVTMIFWRKPRKPGVVGSLYIVMYAMGRIFNEQFRLPDAAFSNLSEQPLGLSRGQFISLWMLVAGILLLIWSMRRNTKPLGGWAKKTT